jgi:hypothetical protein
MKYFLKLKKKTIDPLVCISTFDSKGLWFSPGPLVSSTNKTDHHDITEILFKVALNTVKLTINAFIMG